ncbi:MAG: GvpL/GvpF family gas vesicle protein [Actinobacteria bacterium]|nr:MAG: GvpL/GvpF family gas vesicle protein [Actinomycetota bacterium]
MAASSATSTAVYVYGVVRADELRAVAAEGVAGTAVELLEHDGLAAVVSKLPAREFRVKRRDLQRHLQVLEEAFAEATIVPCPFGTVVLSEEDLERVLLAERRDELLAALERLEGKVQLNVKAVYDEEELLRELVQLDPELERLRIATKRLGDAGYYEQIRLGELIAAAVSQRRETDASRLLGQLADSTDDAVVEAGGAYVALKASFLVSRKKLKTFDKALERIAQAEQPVMRIEVIGPVPPTAFAAPAAGG